jgi:hypothetical protein
LSFREGENMNNNTLRKRVALLVERDAAGEKKTGGKFAARLSADYLELLERLAILEGCSKTELFRRAVDSYAEGYEEVLHPVSSY